MKDSPEKKARATPRSDAGLSLCVRSHKGGLCSGYPYDRAIFIARLSLVTSLWLIQTAKSGAFKGRLK
jgi:hypothetical protein